MRKRIFLLVFFLVILSISVSARRSGNFSADDAYDWLLQQASNGSYNDDVIDTSAVFLAIDEAGGLGDMEKDYIVSQEKSDHCWPKSSCKIKDTAWAALALNKYGESSYVNDALVWLKNAQTSTLTGGNWWLEIDTPDTGTCTVTYTKGSKEEEKDITVDAGSFPDCGSGTFFDLKTCLEPGLLNKYASLELDIDCSALSSAKISIAYNSGSSYYLYEEVADTTAMITVKNGCFGTGYKDSCNYDSSLYTEWVLNQIDSSLSSELYLRENYDSKNAIHNALLYIITQDKAYAGEIKKLQKSDGSWNSNSLNTAFAILALKDETEHSRYVEKAQEWLKKQQQEDGSWNGKVLNTAMVLYSSFSDDVGELPSCNDYKKNQGERGVDCGGPCEEFDDCCDNGEKDEGEEGIDCGGVCEECVEIVCDMDGTCEEDQGEDCNNCPEDCQTCEELCSNGQIDTASGELGVDCDGYCVSCNQIICDNNGDCDYDLTERYTDFYDNEDSENCPNDCGCGDGICDDAEAEAGKDSDYYCTDDCDYGAMGAKCGDGYCDEGEGVSCPEDCVGESSCDYNEICDFEFEDCDCSDCVDEDFCKEGGGGGFIWILIILIFLALGGGAYFFLTKRKGKPKKPAYSLYGRGTGPSLPSRKTPEKPGAKGSFFSGLTKPKQPAAPQRPVSARRPEKKSKLDSEIEKSIEEAKKLIKGE